MKESKKLGSGDGLLLGVALPWTGGTTVAVEVQVETEREKLVKTGEITSS